LQSPLAGGVFLMVSGSGTLVLVMVMKTVCISGSLLVWVGSAFGETWTSLVDSVFYSDYAYAYASWSFGHSPIIIIAVIFVSCSSPGDNNNNKSVIVFVLVLWLSVFEIPLLDFSLSVGVSDSGSSINIITKTRMIHTNFFAS
jgi:hypothetical protein